jgi:hypothetical protein
MNTTQNTQPAKKDDLKAPTAFPAEIRTGLKAGRYRVVAEPA